MTIAWLCCRPASTRDVPMNAARIRYSVRVSAISRSHTFRTSYPTSASYSHSDCLCLSTTTPDHHQMSLFYHVGYVISLDGRFIPKQHLFHRPHVLTLFIRSYGKLTTWTLPSNLRPATRDCLHLVTTFTSGHVTKMAVTPFDPS